MANAVVNPTKSDRQVNYCKIGDLNVTIVQVVDSQLYKAICILGNSTRSPRVMASGKTRLEAKERLANKIATIRVALGQAF